MAELSQGRPAAANGLSRGLSHMMLATAALLPSEAHAAEHLKTSNNLPVVAAASPLNDLAIPRLYGGVAQSPSFGGPLSGYKAAGDTKTIVWGSRLTGQEEALFGASTGVVAGILLGAIRRLLEEAKESKAKGGGATAFITGNLGLVLGSIGGGLGYYLGMTPVQVVRFDTEIAGFAAPRQEATESYGKWRHLTRKISFDTVLIPECPLPIVARGCFGCIGEKVTATFYVNETDKTILSCTLAYRPSNR